MLCLFSSRRLHTICALVTGVQTCALPIYAVERHVRLFRYGTDCYAYALLAAGHVDLVIENGLKPYDVGALIPLIEQAGGIITTWDGGRPEDGGNIVAAGSRFLHEQAMAILNGG